MSAKGNKNTKGRRPSADANVRVSLDVGEHVRSSLRSDWRHTCHLGSSYLPAFPRVEARMDPMFTRRALLLSPGPSQGFRINL